ncbi:MAG: hypothetical protein WC346_00125 [Methanogenium sp.]|jgi:hypothetical protein
MTTYYVDNATILTNWPCAVWTASRAYGLGDRVVCTTGYGTVAARAFVYECTQAGTSGSGQPAWPTTEGNTVSDGGAIWTARYPTSWANASAFSRYISNHLAAAGDLILVDKDHSEAGFNAYLYGSTDPANPLRMICVDRDNSNALSVGAIIPLSGYGFDRYLYSYGVKYTQAGSAVSIYVGQAALGHIILESNGGDVIDCTASNTTNINIGGSYQAILEIRNGGIKFAGTSTYILVGRYGTLLWRKGIFTGADYHPYLFTNSGIMEIQDVDFSDLIGGKLYKFNAVDYGMNHQYKRCKFPNPSTGFKICDESVPIWRGLVPIKFYNCSHDNYNTRLLELSAEGRSENDRTVYKTDGASDGVISFSQRLSSSIYVVDNIAPLRSSKIMGWTEATSVKTFTIECVYAGSVNLQDDEIWMELEYPANDTDGLGAFITDKCAVNGTPADQASSSVEWTTAGLLPGTGVSSWSLTLTQDYSTTNRNVRSVLAAANIATSGAWCRIRIAAHGTSGTILDGVSIGERDGSTSSTVGTPTRVTFNGGQNSVVIGAGHSAWSDWLQFAIDETKDYLVHCKRAGGFNQRGVASGYCYYKDTTDDDTLVEDLSGYSEAASTIFVTELEVASSISVNKFKLSVSATPGRRGPLVAQVCLAKARTNIYFDPKITES